MTERRVEYLPLDDVLAAADPQNPSPALLRARPLIEKAREGRGDDECWPWPGTPAKHGYGVIVYHYRQYRVTRLILGIENADWLLQQACHTCDNPPCVNPRHLFIGTAAENQQDKGRKGRAARGEQNGGGGKLTADDVRRIREMIESGLTNQQIAEDFPVTSAMVYRIRTGKVWRHVA